MKWIDLGSHLTSDICIFDILFLYSTLQYLGVEVKSLDDQINSKLIGSNIY